MTNRLQNHFPWILELALLLAGPASADSLQTWSAEYLISKNGKPQARMKQTLLQEENHYHLQSITTATRGPLRWMGGKINESSRFSVQDEQIAPIEYHYESKILGIKKTTHARFDHQAGTLHIGEPGKEESIPLPVDLTDRQLLPLLIGWQEITETRSFHVLNRKHISEWEIHYSGEERHESPDGEVISLCYQRKTDRKASHNKFCLAPGLNRQLIYMEYEKDGDQLTSELISLTLEAAPADADRHRPSSSP